ncbi:MAG: polyprenol monophosphomannose synthase [Bacteroidales bacterium]|nr:polyprenol monophosphomannose synthase [Bacteroidales bacterium]
MPLSDSLTTPIATPRRDSIVIIPMYNERENAAAIINAVLGLDGDLFDILVIEDNSPDGTAEIVKERMQSNPGRVHIIERKGKLGLGTAYIEGFKWALANGYKYICEMDADFSHNPLDLLKLREAVAEDKGDVAVGSRYVTGVNVVNWPMGRVLMSYYASAYVRLVTRMKTRDTTAGFVCYRREVLEDMDLDKIRFKGYAFQIEMKFTATELGYRVVEVPIIFINRVLGTSKMSSGIFGEALFGVMRLKWSSIWKKKKRRVHRPAPQK